ncbi:MAG: O-antigen ligase family protein [Bacteroidia bacterium]|nr:O-antigen ligase family protein [Bacteroidia bacterium]
MVPKNLLLTLQDFKKEKWFYIISAAFIIINIIMMAQANYYFNLVPFALLIILYTIFALDKLIFLIVFFTPLSIPLREFLPHTSVDMSLPTEPLLFGVMLLFLFKLLVEKNFDKKILKHPVSIVIYLNLTWIFITSLTSTMPLVSFKFFIARCWFVVVFYLMATLVFKKYNFIKTYFWCYIIPMIFVIGFTLYRLSGYGFFDEKAAHEVMNPIYNDHTSYAAVLAMLCPVLFGLLFYSGYPVYKKIISFAVLVIFIIAIIFSYTRASWLSMAAALAFWILLMLKIKLKTIFISAFILIALFFAFKTEIVMRLEKNRQDSSTNLKEHIQSISNVTSDASNVERLNRWSCAIRMFEAKPVFGWGPGTYMFKYAPFQLSYEKTIISTNAGNRGNAHSEYLGPLSESGLLGMVTFTLIVLFTIYTGAKVYRNAINKKIKLMALILNLSLVTYYVHGILNNFLDTDKASALFWGFTAMIVALDIYHNKLSETAA